MRICLVLEGSYPYVHGGVSTWMHAYIQAMPQQEFSLWVIGAKAQDRGKFVYELPPNVKEVEEVFWMMPSVSTVSSIRSCLPQTSAPPCGNWYGWAARIGRCCTVCFRKKGSTRSLFCRAGTSWSCSRTSA